MDSFVAAYLRRAIFAMALVLTGTFAAGYFARPHFPLPAKVTSGYLVAIGETPTIVILVNDHGEAADYPYQACIADDECRATVKRLVHLDKIQILVMTPKQVVS